MRRRIKKILNGALGEEGSGALPEVSNGSEPVAGPSGVKRKADDDVEVLQTTGPNAKNSRLDIEPEDDNENPEDEVRDSEHEQEDHDEDPENEDEDEDSEHDPDEGDVSFGQMADILDQSQEESKKQISLRLRELKEKYKKVLKLVDNIYNTKRPTHLIFPPIVYRDITDKTKILGIEGLQEYIDNQHPLWEYEKKEYNNPTCNLSDLSDLSDYIHTRWGNQNINPRSNLVVLEASDEGVNKEDLAANYNQNVQHQTENRPEKDLQKRAFKTIMEMDIDAISLEVLEKEKARNKLYQQKVNPLFGEGIKDANIKVTTSESLVSFNEFSEMTRRRAAENNWSFGAEVAIASTRETLDMASHYTGGDRGLSEDQVDTILDMEETYGKILEIDKNAEDENKNTRNQD